MTETKRPLGWLKKLIPSALRSGSATQPAEVAAPAVQSPAVNTHVVFLPRDPQWAYCFWAISDSDRRKASEAGATSLCLRVADVTGLGADQSHPHALQELVVDQHAC